MMRLLGKVVVASLALYAVVLFAFPTHTHRFRLTFQIEQDGRIKEGSGVITVMDQDNSWLPLTQNKWKRTARGPSPWIDLGNDGILAVAMQPFRTNYEPEPNSAGDLSFMAYFGGVRGSMGINAKSVREIHKQSGRRALREDQMPEFVWIPNPLDPASAKIVHPEKLSETIGHGVRFVGAFVEMTTDRPDSSLMKKLPWLDAMTREEIRTGHRTISATFAVGPYNLVGDLW